jgi:hypothetical protein
MTIAGVSANPNIEASRVEGTEVFNRAGDRLGYVEDVVIGKQDGQVKYAIMAFGGFLGIGESHHPLPWSVLDFEEAHGGYVVDLTREQLEGAPSYTADKPDWNDAAYNRVVDDYYKGFGRATHDPGLL